MENEKLAKRFLMDGSEQTVQDIVSKLQFIARIKSGEKVDLYSLQLVSAESWMNSAYRTFISRGESRDATFEFIKANINRGFELAHMYLTRKQEYFCNIGCMIIKAIIDAKSGINNISKTYATDAMYVSEIHTFINIVNSKLTDINRQFPENIILNNK